MNKNPLALFLTNITNSSNLLMRNDGYVFLPFDQAKNSNVSQHFVSPMDQHLVVLFGIHPSASARWLCVVSSIILCAIPFNRRLSTALIKSHFEPKLFISMPFFFLLDLYHVKANY